MGRSRILVVDLDVHKYSIDIALAKASRDALVRHLATVAGGGVAVTKALRRLISAGRQLQSTTHPHASDSRHHAIPETLQFTRQDKFVRSPQFQHPRGLQPDDWLNELRQICPAGRHP